MQTKSHLTIKITPRWLTPAHIFGRLSNGQIPCTGALEGAPRIYSVVKGAVDETFKHFVTIHVNNNKKRVLRGRSCSYAAVNQSHLWNINDSRIPMWGLYSRSYVSSLVQSYKTTTTSVSCSSRNLIRTLEIVILLLQIFYLMIKMMMKASSVPKYLPGLDPVWATARSLAVRSTVLMLKWWTRWSHCWYELFYYYVTYPQQ